MLNLLRKRRPDLLICAALFLLVFFVHAYSPNATPFDSRWTIYSADSLLVRGNLRLDPFLPVLERDHFYAIECVTADGHRTYPIATAAQCPAGHYYNFYPAAVAILAAPEVFALRHVLALARPILRPLAEGQPDGPRRRFLLNDFPGGVTVTEILIACFFIALAAVAIYAIARQFLSLPFALIPPLVFAFCTPAWSTGSRALWQHTPSMLLLACALWLAIRADKHPRAIPLLGAVLALDFFVRPTNVIALLCFSGFVVLRHRRQLTAYAAGMLPIFLGFVALAWSIYGTPLAPYFLIHRDHAPGLSISPEMATALAGNLISPSRGLFVFVPVFAFSIVGMFGRPATPAARVLRPWLIAMAVLHWLLISSFEDWSAGHSFGPRYFSDLTPIFIYFLIPFIDRMRAYPNRALTAAFLLLAGVSFFIHYRGATKWATMEWNVTPVEISQKPARLWDWHDVQFLRGL